MRKSHPILVGIEEVAPYPTTPSHALYKVRPPMMQIDQFLTVGGVMGVTAYPGVGKTWLALEVTRAVASGTPFLGRYRAMRGGVLFVGSDSSLFDYAYQWSRLTKATPNAEEVFEPVRFLIQSPFLLEDENEVRRLIRTHQVFEWGEMRDGPDGPERERGFHTIIIDTVSRTTRANQNDNSEMEGVFRHVRWLAEATDAAVILLHHNAKRSEYNDGSDWRGAMSQIAGLDSWVHLAPHRRDKYLIGVTFKKFRGITPEDFTYHMNVTDPTTASLEASDESVVVENPVTTAIMEYVKVNPNKRAVEIRDALWPRFSVGVADLNGKTVVFAAKEKFYNYVNNRLVASLARGDLKRVLNEEGKSVYRATKKPKKATATAKVQDGDAVPTPPQRGDASESGGEEA